MGSQKGSGEKLGGGEQERASAPGLQTNQSFLVCRLVLAAPASSGDTRLRHLLLVRAGSSFSSFFLALFFSRDLQAWWFLEVSSPSRWYKLFFYNEIWQINVD